MFVCLRAWDIIGFADHLLIFFSPFPWDFQRGSIPFPLEMKKWSIATEYFSLELDEIDESLSHQA